ncbi:MAG: outer membrane beta-barrel protein, partial [Alphaproteobacteria bacterium]
MKTTYTALLCLAAAPVWAGDFYISGKGGMVDNESQGLKSGTDTLEVSFDNGTVGAGAIGYSFNQGKSINVRLEGELAHKQVDVASGSFNGHKFRAAGDEATTAMMANMYVDFNAKGRVRPFIGAGVGMARTAID